MKKKTHKTQTIGGTWTDAKAKLAMDKRLKAIIWGKPKK